MAPHSSTLAWKIPWTEEPGGLQSMGSWRVGHDWATSLSLSTFMHWRRKWQPTPGFLPGESQGCPHRVGHDWSDSSINSRLLSVVRQFRSFCPQGINSSCSRGDPSIPCLKTREEVLATQGSCEAHVFIQVLKHLTWKYLSKVIIYRDNSMEIQLILKELTWFSTSWES